MPSPKRIGSCAYCGREAPITKDHIPPQNLFPDPKPSNLIKAAKAIARACDNAFNNPESEKIKKLYADVLQIPDITTAWWGNPEDKTGQSPLEFCKIIDDMMNLRHDTAHGKWRVQISADDCVRFLSTAAHLAVRTDEHVARLFP